MSEQAPTTKDCHVLNESIGSRISSTLRLWNAMNGLMSRAESGESYLRPCFIVNDLRRRFAVGVSVKAMRIIYKWGSPLAPSIRPFQPLYKRRMPNLT